jgi:hypothetical protein
VDTAQARGERGKKCNEKISHRTPG